VQREAYEEENRKGRNKKEGFYGVHASGMVKVVDKRFSICRVPSEKDFNELLKG